MTDEIEVLTGNVTVTVYDMADKPIKNARVKLNDNNNNSYEGLTSYTGECLLEDVIYNTYTIKVTHTGYTTEENTITVDDETITTTVTLTHLPIDPTFIEVDLDEPYEFTISGQVVHDYAFTTNLINWLQGNLESLKDDYDVSLFGKVNTGFNDSSLKTFGKRPVCDVYINKVEYTGDFDNHYPDKVNTIVIVYLKGANNHTYSKACELHDLLMQQFIINEDFRRLTDIVSDTYITNSELRVQPLQKKWGVIVAFELSHTLY